MNTVKLVLLAVLVAALFAGCATDSPTPAGGNPGPFSLTLFTSSTHLRYTYFELDKKGDLQFGGGRDGALRHGTPVTTLSPEQLQQVWTIIEHHDLLHAKGAGMFAKGEKTTYELDIHSSRGNRSVRAVDDQTPGLAELHDFLFNIQAQVRYKVPGIQ